MSNLKYTETYVEKLIKDLKTGKFGFYIYGSKDWHFGVPDTKILKMTNFLYIPVNEDTSPSYLSKLMQNAINNISTELISMKNDLKEKLNKLKELQK